jgi:glucan phosphoethanolaminetransferase (alkaline phosphatase superfamily)
MEKEKTKTQIKKPIGVILIAVFYFLASILYLATAIIAFFYKNLLTQLPNFNIPEAFVDQAILTLGILFLVLSLLSLIIAIALLKRKNWARVFVIIFSFILIIGGVFSLIEGNYISSINLLINLIIAAYLLFSKKVKRYFKA